MFVVRLREEINNNNQTTRTIVFILIFFKAEQIQQRNTINEISFEMVVFIFISKLFI